MAFRLNLSVNQALDGCSAVVIGVQSRRVNTKYHNSEDIAMYPKVVMLAITNDPSRVNNGQIIRIKLKKADNLSIGQEITFNANDGAKVPHGKVYFWTRNGFVNVAMKGDNILN